MDFRFANVCISNLRQIEAAKDIWAEEQGKAAGDLPNEEDLFGPGKRPKPECPKGGPYRLNGVGTSARCSYPGHTLEN